MPRGFYRLAKAEYTRLTSPDEDGNPVAIPDAHVVADTGPQVYLHAARYPHKWLETNAAEGTLKALGDTWGKMHKALATPTREKVFRQDAEGDEEDPENPGVMRRVRRGFVADAVPVGWERKGGLRISHAWGARESVKHQRKLDEDLGQEPEPELEVK